MENRAANKSSPFCPSLCYSACLCPGVKSQFFSFSLHSSSPCFIIPQSIVVIFISFSLPCCLCVPFLLFPSLSRYALFEASISARSSLSSCAGRCPEGAHCHFPDPKVVEQHWYYIWIKHPDLCLSSNLRAISDGSEFVVGRSCMAYLLLCHPWC